MPIWKYTIVAADGFEHTGEVDAPTREDVLRMLRESGLRDFRVDDTPKSGSGAPGGGGISGSPPPAAGGGAGGGGSPPIPPTPSPGPGDSPGDRDLDKVITHLKTLVDLTTVGNMLRQAQLSAMLGGLPVSVPTIGGAPELPPVSLGVGGRAGGDLLDPAYYGEPITAPGGYPPGYVPPPGVPVAGGTGGGSPAPGGSPEPGHDIVSPTTRLAYEQEAGEIGVLGALKKKVKFLGGRIKTNVREAVGAVRGTYGAAVSRGRKIGGKIGGLFGSKGGAIGRGIGAGVGVAAGTVGVAVGGAVALGTALFKANEAVGAWTDAAFRSSERLAQVSGSMAAVHAQREVRQLMRDIQRGEKTAGSAKDLMESEDRRKNAFEPLMTSLDNLLNTALSIANDILTGLMDFLNPIFELLWEAFRTVVKAITAALPGVSEKDIGPYGGKKPGGTGVGMIGEVGGVFAAVDRMNKMGKDLMKIARDAAMRPGYAAPVGAGGPGVIGGV